MTPYKVNECGYLHGTVSSRVSGAFDVCVKVTSRYDNAISNNYTDALEIYKYMQHECHATAAHSSVSNVARANVSPFITCPPLQTGGFHSFSDEFV